MKSQHIKIIGIAPWRLVPLEPRHNTWHNSLFDTAEKLGVKYEYIGLKKTFKTNWITRVFPDSILKKFPYLSIFSFISILRKLKRDDSSKTLIYIFEGSFFWLFILFCFNNFIPNCVIVCNLFASSRYDKRIFRNNKLRKFYDWLFRVLNLQKNNNVVVTFDTQIMVDKVNYSYDYGIRRFPVPSSFPHRKLIDFNQEVHHKVLVNMRSFSTDRLHELLKNSCAQCNFVFPRGPLKTIPLKLEFSKYKNTSFDDEVIPVKDYQSYIDFYDYMIFLYQPSIDASGRILDCLTRGIPVCVPEQATEWASIARNWGRAHLFDWTSQNGLEKVFNHPGFSDPIFLGEPPFTPKGTIRELLGLTEIEINNQKKLSSIKKVATLMVILIHGIIAVTLSGLYSLLFKIKSSNIFRNLRLKW
jgi:hypothetical protein